ncbi:Hypothetical predicted protein [Pelobates cultripes]|uniref:Uncharacterized protein n=1 Tax=Pelobates cultripes TaxID=61616 RepID=A0AAD1W525_PELCU|nr:Hypothetical predicted protein [Pelobates cultripes]
MMGKKPKHQKASKPTGARDIGDLLLCPAKAAEAFAPKYNGDTTSASSGEQALDELDEFPSTGGLHGASSDEENDLPSTKGDIKALLRHIHTRCIQLEAHNTELRRSQILLKDRLDTEEDWHRSRNIKIRGIPETVSQDDLPHFVERLLATLLTPQQVTAAAIDVVYRIPRAAKAPAGTSRDVILQLQTRAAQRNIMAAVRGKTTHLFDTANLSFYQDLSKPTLTWRGLFKPLTATLRQHSIPYRWAFPRSLVITHGGATTHITDPSEMDSVLSALDLPPRQEQTTPARRPTTPHVWDMTAVKPFQPANPGASASTTFKAQRAAKHPSGAWGLEGARGTPAEKTA